MNSFGVFVTYWANLAYESNSKTPGYGGGTRRILNVRFLMLSVPAEDSKGQTMNFTVQCGENSNFDYNQ